MKLNVKLATKEYDIILERGCIQKLSKYMDTSRNVMIITDENIPKQYVNTITSQIPNSHVTIVPNGEKAKNLDVYRMCLENCLGAQMSRKDLIIALGGGVIGDLAGFVASSYMRGIEFVAIPTSTLSMVDSSIGGKVAIDLAGVKNIVGAFHHPSIVLIDFDTLETLDKRNYKNGLIEALKSGIIHDPELFKLFVDNMDDNLEEIIYKSLLVKKKVVEEDEKEQNIRKTLNFGHTIGHGIESSYELSEYLHGECVGAGMMYFIANPELKKQIKRIYSRYEFNIPMTYDIEKVYEYIKHDKKAVGDMVTVCVVRELGKAELGNMLLPTIKEMLQNRVDLL